MKIETRHVMFLLLTHFQALIFIIKINLPERFMIYLRVTNLLEFYIFSKIIEDLWYHKTGSVTFHVVGTNINSFSLCIQIMCLPTTKHISLKTWFMFYSFCFPLMFSMRTFKLPALEKHG